MLLKPENNKFVIFRTDRIGEVVLSTVALKSLKKAFPGSRVSYVTSAYSRPILENVMDIDIILNFETGDNKSIFSKAFKLSRLLRELSFDAAIVLNPHKASHLAAFLAGIPLRIGYKRKWGFLLNKTIPDTRDKGEKHETEYTMDLLKIIGAGGEPSFPYIKVREKGNVIKFLKENNIRDDKPLILIHPGTSNPVKMWPKENFANLISKIKDKIDCNIVLVGDEKERDLAGDIVNMSGAKSVNSAGKFDLEGLMFIISRGNMFIGNDAGPMHIAECLGIPLAAIFIQTDPGTDSKRWGPISEKSATLEKTREGVKVDSVFAETMRLLGK